MRPIAALQTLILGWLACAAASHAQEYLAANCEDMLDTRNLTLYRAEWRPAGESGPAHCHVQGQIAPGIAYYVQMPPCDCSWSPAWPTAPVVLARIPGTGWRPWWNGLKTAPRRIP